MCCFLPLGIFVVVHSLVFPSYTKSESLCCSCGLEGAVNALLPISTRETWWWMRGNFGLWDRDAEVALQPSLRAGLWGTEPCQALWLWPQRVWSLTVMALVISDYHSSSSHLEELWLNERSISLSNFYLKILSSVSTVEYRILSFWALLSVMQCCSWNDLFQLWGQFK